MTCHVGPLELRPHAKKVRGRVVAWATLTADTEEELSEMATQLGVTRYAKGTGKLDLTAGQRERAIALGVVADLRVLFEGGR